MNLTTGAPGRIAAPPSGVAASASPPIPAPQGREPDPPCLPAAAPERTLAPFGGDRLRGASQPPRSSAGKPDMAQVEPKEESKLDPVVAAYLADIDRSLIRKNLALTVEQRFLQLMELQRFASELRRGARRARAG